MNTSLTVTQALLVSPFVSQSLQGLCPGHWTFCAPQLQSYTMGTKINLLWQVYLKGYYHIKQEYKYTHKSFLWEILEKAFFFFVTVFNILICLQWGNCENHTIFHTSGCSLHSTFQKLGEKSALLPFLFSQHSGSEYCLLLQWETGMQIFPESFWT